MEQHPIDGLMKTAMESIKDMVDVNTVIGEPVETPEGSVIIPISKVALGFGSGGSDFEICGSRDGGSGGEPLPAFGGGAGAGMSVKPVGFLIAGNGQVRMLPVDGHAIYDRLLDLAPQMAAQVQIMLDKYKRGKEQEQEPQGEDVI